MIAHFQQICLTKIGETCNEVNTARISEDIWNNSANKQVFIEIHFLKNIWVSTLRHRNRGFSHSTDLSRYSKWNIKRQPHNDIKKKNISIYCDAYDNLRPFPWNNLKLYIKKKRTSKDHSYGTGLSINPKWSKIQFRIIFLYINLTFSLQYNSLPLVRTC